jgi:alkylation response protein AidB-like acyl-CoA dehydrogenase
MDLLPSPEQEEIVASIARFLSAEVPPTKVRAQLSEPSSVDPKLWSAVAGLGWFGLGLAEDAGGVGYGLPEEALLFREIGRHLAPGPFLATLLGARVAAVAGHDARASILAGSRVVALAELHGGRCTPDDVSGPVTVHDGVDADLAVVVTPTGAALVEPAGLADLQPSPSIDPGTRLATGRADGLRPLAFVEAAVDPIFARGTVLASAELTGLAEAARDQGAEHARTREQFGRPIGVHQAVKHACTDMAVRAEAAVCQTFLAAVAVGDDLADGAFQAASAKVVAGDAALRNARANIQIHGGMGFTWEHDAHLLLKRAHVLGQVLGDRRHHLRDLLSRPPVQ